MPPLLSLVVPFHNHSESLPRLLDSVLAQDIASETEVVLVDDASDESCGSIAEAYAGKGLHVVFARLPERQYTKNARLEGAARASGAAVAFADADDVLWGTDILGSHVRRLLDEDADMLHARTVLLNSDRAFVREYGDARPLAARLEGAEIFRRAMNTPGYKWTLWSKVVTRSLLSAAYDAAGKSSVRRYREDVLLSVLLHFHARRYIGSDQVGYGYRRVDKDLEKAPGRALSCWHMLQELPPYLAGRGCPPDTVDLFSRKTRRFMEKNIRILCASLCASEMPCLSDAVINELLAHGTYSDVMRMLYSVAPPEKGRSLPFRAAIWGYRRLRGLFPR